MESPSLYTLSCLSNQQKAYLQRGNLVTVADVMVSELSDIAKKCKIEVQEVHNCINAICEELCPQPRTLKSPDIRLEMFTSGDAALDAAIGGGVRTGMLWEIAGESAAGKTQMALQVSLTVQLPRNLGGLAGSACFFLTSKTLYTNRLLEMAECHPLLSPATCGLSEIHATNTPTIPKLIRALSNELPVLCENKISQPESKPIKLVVIDTLTELFHLDSKTSTSTLSQRSRDLAVISTLLHTLAHKYNLAVVVLNEVSDAFESPLLTDSDDLIYRNQARFFNRADSTPGEDRKEAALGLVWANQVNARIMLTRTQRMRYLDDAPASEPPSKRRKLEEQCGEVHINAQSTRLRRLSVIFSNVASPTSLDYIVTTQGISIIPEEPSTPPVQLPPVAPTKSPGLGAATTIPRNKDDTLSVYDTIPSSQSQPPLPTFEALVSSDDGPQAPPEGTDAENGPEPEEDEWEAYWREVDSMDDLYADTDVNAPSSNLPNTRN